TDADTNIYGSSGDDIVRVLLAGLADGTNTFVHGEDPSTATKTDPGDTLILDPQDPTADIHDPNYPTDIETGGTAFLTGRGTIHFDTFETGLLLSGPVVSFQNAPYTEVEGGDVTLTVNVTANGSSNTLSTGDLLQFDMEGNGNFGDFTAVAV